MLRRAAEARTEIGLEAKRLMDEGQLVPDEVMCGLVRERVAEPDVVESGFLLDGFPRTLRQAKDLMDIIGPDGIDLALNLEVSEHEVKRRMLERGRDDDTPEVIQHRLQLYLEETVPAIDWFEDLGVLVTVPAEGTEDEVTSRLVAAIDAR